jgi:small subunit ribosomal protein S4
MSTVKKYKICRRLGAGIYEKCTSQKFMISEEKRSRIRRGRRPKRPSDYAIQLIKKQRARFMYGVSEKQFSGYVKKAVLGAKKGLKPANLVFQLLEGRLDNVVYRTGLAKTRRMARQMVSHGHFLVNGTRTTVPSYQISASDLITILEGSKVRPMFVEALVLVKTKQAAKWLSWDGKKSQITVTGTPTEPDAFLDFQTVIEFYTR